jgi:hypothetical protein
MKLGSSDPYLRGTILYRQRDSGPDDAPLAVSIWDMTLEQASRFLTACGNEVLFTHHAGKEAAYAAYWRSQLPLITAEQFHDMVGGEDAARALKSAADKCGGIDKLLGS